MTRCSDRRAGDAVRRWSRSSRAASPGTAAPAVAADAAGRIAAGLDVLLLGRIIRPAGRQLGRLDFLACAGRRRGAAPGAAGAPGCRRRLVQRALDAGLAASGRLGAGFSRAPWRPAPSWARVIIERMAAASASALRRRSLQVLGARGLFVGAGLRFGSGLVAASAAALSRLRLRLGDGLRGLGFGGLGGGGAASAALACAACRPRARLRRQRRARASPRRARALRLPRARGAFRPVLLPGGGSVRPGGALLPRGAPVRLRRRADGGGAGVAARALRSRRCRRLRHA